MAQRRNKRVEMPIQGVSDAADGSLGPEDDAERQELARAIEDTIGEADAEASEQTEDAYDRPTLAERRERLNFCVLMLQRHLYKSDIKRRMRTRYKGISARTIERYLSRARKVLVGRYRKLSANPKQDSVMFWLSLVQGPDTDIRTKMRARERLDKLLGLDRMTDEEDRNAGEHPGVNEILVTTRQEANEILALTREEKDVAVGNTQFGRESGRQLAMKSRQESPKVKDVSGMATPGIEDQIRRNSEFPSDLLGFVEVDRVDALKNGY
jgi:hypothetical protein